MKRLVCALMAAVLMCLMCAGVMAEENERKGYAEAYRDYTYTIARALVAMYEKNPTMFDAEYAEMLYVYTMLFDFSCDAYSVEVNYDVKADSYSGGKGIRETLILNPTMAKIEKETAEMTMNTWYAYRIGEGTLDDFVTFVKIHLDAYEKVKSN